ncbi:hypothetical protein [Spirosoma sp. KNUC1025]|uniref:hypothetical protein n=1 Tax=Spirosoma sp. KNUC1025 TaxID=2894082 RepID=UPI0038699E29|nr:hypothetical protein LN737_17500 [Spirosoma sp. KNUC1025]
MKAKQIRFFSPNENSEATKKEKKVTAKAEPVKGYISAAGKLVFPDKAIAQLGFDPNNKQFKVGTQDGKRKIKSLFLIPAEAGQDEAFEMTKGAKSYSISLSFILQKGGIDFAAEKYGFTIKPFDYEGGVTGFELKLASESPKPEYTGKPRGRKRQAPVSE